jgi:hypothetical protein
MKGIWRNRRQWLMLFSILFFVCAIIGMTGAGAQPVQAGFSVRRTPTPRRLPTATRTPTPWPIASPTPGSTTTVDGTWKIVTSPNVGTGTYGNQLNAVTLVSANDVWAVGFSPDPSGTPLYIRQSLIEHWDGISWSVVSSPNPAGDTATQLIGVAAVSASDIWAVGHYGTNFYQTLTEHWNGTSWSIIPSPNPGTGSDLKAVAAISANDVWAVGQYFVSSAYHSLAMHWNGATWTVFPTSTTGTLYGITALASNDVWAVGDQVIVHWDGANWSNAPFPQPPAGGATFYQLRGISATDANDIWAVGIESWTYNSGYLYRPVSYHWDGNLWSLVPNSGNTNEYFFGVMAIARNDVWAVGDNGQTQHWNGVAWSRVAAPYPDQGGRFNDVAAVSAGDVWAVGAYSQSGTNQLRTWTEHYTVP